MGIFASNMKFLCLTMSLGEVCKDDASNNAGDTTMPMMTTDKAWLYKVLW